MATAHRLKLALGTVQFGLDYGVSNRQGRTPADEVARILEFAAAAGIDTLDTARAYGDAEQVLGALQAGARFRIVTKTAPGATGEALRASVGSSLAALGQSRVDALLFHRAEDLLGEAGERSWAVAESLRDAGLVGQLGLSAYTGDELRAAITRYPLDIVQVPANLLDQRLLRDGTLADLKARGVEVHVRSGFLQGLLLMDPAEVPAPLAGARPAIAELDARCRAAGIGRAEACLGFLAARADVDRIVVGVNTVGQLRELVEAAARGRTVDAAGLAIDDPDIIDPSRWKLPS